MQKIFLCIVLTAVSIVNAFGAEPVVVKSGNINVFAEQGTALIKFVYKSAEVNDMPIEEYIEKKGGDKYAEKWNKWRKTSEMAFVSDFNKYNKGLKLTKNKKESFKYSIIVTFKVLHTGNTLKGFLPTMSLKDKKGSAMMNGTVEVKDTKGNSVCVLALRNIYGTDGFNVSSRLMTLYLEMDKRIRKAVKKSENKSIEKEDDDEKVKATSHKKYIDEEDEEDEEVKTKKNKKYIDEEDEEDEEVKTKKNKKYIDEEDEEDEEVKTKKNKKYIDEEDEEDEEVKTKKNKKYIDEEDED